MTIELDITLARHFALNIRDSSLLRVVQKVSRLGCRENYVWIFGIACDVSLEALTERVHAKRERPGCAWDGVIVF